MDNSFLIIGIFIAMALDAKFDRSYRPELYAANIIGGPDFMATQAAGCDCRMDGLPLRFIFMTLQTLAPVRILFQGGRMLCSKKG